MDRATWLALSARTPEATELLRRTDWFNALWVLGRMELWGGVALVMITLELVRLPRHLPRPLNHALRRGTLLLLSSGLAGLVAEVLKVVFRRERPIETGGWYRFRSVFERTFDGSGLGLPSGHAAVAFGAAFALALMFPRLTWLFLLMAIACGIGRILAGAHFLSDVYVSILLAYGLARAVAALDLRNNEGRPIASHG